MVQYSVRELVTARYGAAYGAVPPVNYPHHITVEGADGLSAVLGYRLAAEQPLFLEAYLDAPVEQLLAQQLDRAVARDAVVELGEHASRKVHATRMLWEAAAEQLQGRAEIAVAVLTAPMRRMLERLGLPLVALAPARAECLGEDAARWGRYYGADPIVCAGEIGAGRRCLAARSAVGRRARP